MTRMLIHEHPHLKLRAGRRSDVKNLLRKLLLGYTQYFSYDLLNSEGRKVFEEMARMLVHEHPYLKPMVVRARRKPTLENVLKIARLVLGEEADQLPLIAVQGPYVDELLRNDELSGSTRAVRKPAETDLH